MKIIFAILVFLSLHAQAQKSAQWVTLKETYVVNYEVQRSTDQQTWNIFTTIQPTKKDSNYYICVLPLTTNYYRVKANMINGAYYTKEIKLTTISDAGEDEIIQLPTNSLNISGTFLQQTN